MVMGAKGGVGKSLFSIALIEIFGNEKVYVIDTDKSNPDVYKVASGKLECVAIELTDIDGYSLLCSEIADHKDDDIIINTRAANDDSVAANWDILLDASSELKKPITVWWIVNAHIDSVVLLKKFFDQYKNYEITINVVLNRHFGKLENFNYLTSNTAKAMEERGAKLITISQLSTSVENAIYKDRSLFSDIINNGRFGDKLSVNKFIREIKNQLV